MKTFAVAMIVFLATGCNLGNGGGVSVCEGLPSMNGNDIIGRKESGHVTRAKEPRKRSEPLLLLRMLTEL